MLLALGLVRASYAQSTGQKLDQLVSAYASLKEFQGTALVAMQGKVLLEKGYGPQNIARHLVNNAATIYEIASVTKTFTSTLILKLAELHQLSLNDKLSKYYPDYPHADSITMKQLLSHTAGVYDYTHNRDFMYNRAGDPISEKDMLAMFEHQPLDFPPGTDWSYSNSGYQLLGYIIQKVTGLTYEQAVRKYIFQPLGMNHSGFDFQHLDSARTAAGYYADTGKDYVNEAPLVDSSVTLSAGSMYATTGDLYKWHLSLQQNQIISEADLEIAYTPVRHHYGYGWIIDSLYGKRMVSHSGGIFGFRSNFARIPADDLCIILLSNTETPSLDELARSIVALLYGKPYTIPVKKTAVKLSDTMLKNYTGTYQIKTPPLAIDIKLENGRLVSYPYHGPRAEMLASDETHFYLKEEEGFEMVFEKDSTGKVTRMVLKNNGTTRVADKEK